MRTSEQQTVQGPNGPDRQDPRDARRAFLKGAGLALAGGLLPGVGASAVASSVADPARGDALAAAQGGAAAKPLSPQAKLDRLASNSYPMRSLFKRRPPQAGGGAGGPGAGGAGRGTGASSGSGSGAGAGAGAGAGGGAGAGAGGGGGMAGGRGAAMAQAAQAADAMKKKYGEITLLDFPQFTKDRFPGVRHMDVWSSLFGDVTDASMYIETKMTLDDGRTRSSFEFDPASASGRKWLEQLAAKQAAAGVKCHHVSNNAPRNISDLDPALRRQGIDVAKKWLDACAILGAKSMRVNTGGPRIVPGASATTGYPKNDEIVKLIANAIESFKEMADYGGKVGVKVTIENHWGLSADPMNVRIILDEVKHPFCEASPDFCNWEHEYMLYHGLQALAPYSHTTCHAKYWDRWTSVDLPRCVRIMNEGGFKGIFALEYEDGPWDGVEGAQHLMQEVLKGL